MNTENSLEQDKEILISIVEEMAASFSGKQSTKHWSEDVLWYDIPPFASRGIKPAIRMFDAVFGSLKSCDDTILKTDVIIGSEIGVVCSIHKVAIEFKENNIKQTVMVRQSDFFRKDKNNKWTLIHQHASVPHGGEWDGEIVIE